VAFSVLVGVGAVGMLLRPWLGGPLLAAAALGGGLLFEGGLARPIWKWLFRFESQAALTLETAVTQTAEAVTDFDREGHGLVAVEVDGQLLQVLGTLTPEDRAAGRVVRRGHQVRIESVDGVRGRCTVSYLGT
jgi:hypothetical protein